MVAEDVVRAAWEAGTVVPAFNVPYLPMLAPIVKAVADQDSFALIETARIEWQTFECYGPAAVQEAFARFGDPDYVRLHLDHVPVVDEDDLEVDYLPIVRKAIAVGYASVMVDGSRLPLEANISATRQVAGLAHAAGLPCEAELGSIVREGAGPLPPYEALFASGIGFTQVEEAARFVAETGCDWLSVAVGNLHGAVSKAFKDKKKTEARLDLDHLARLRDATQVPLVLHGGSGVRREDVLAGIKAGIAKINIATEVRQAFEQGLQATGSLDGAKAAVYERTTWLLRDYYGVSGSRKLILG
ncbi:MAG: class II fructose-bisphosphate aldolase [Anaerolineae bacterium]|nr:class II fructose-bisphosphate aldolase [Anaerolineae bacterium]